MKYFLLFLTMNFGWQSYPVQVPVKKVELYFYNDPRMFPIASDVSLFWQKGNRKYLDTLSITDQRFVNDIWSHLRMLNKLDKETYVEYRVAFVIYTPKLQKNDTFYTDSKFVKWEYKSHNYIDTSNYFSKVLSGFVVE